MKDPLQLSLTELRLGLLRQLAKLRLVARSLTGVELSLVHEISYVIVLGEATLLEQDKAEMIEVTDLLLKYRLWVFPRKLAYNF